MTRPAAAPAAHPLTEEIAPRLKTAMRGYASSVVIVSAGAADGTRYAMAATSANCLTLDPPSMLVCINQQVSCYAALSRGLDFCINILSVAHLAVAQSCASAKGEARFAVGDWSDDGRGTPYLTDAQAAIFCVQEKRIAHGTHDVFIGRVRDIRLRDAIDPLVYVGGTYRAVQTASLGGE